MPDAPATTAPASTPRSDAGTQPNSPGPNMAESFAGFDALVAAPESSPSPPEGGGVEISQPTDKKVSEPSETKPAPDTKPAGDKAPSPNSNLPSPTKPAKAATLREELDRTRTEAADWRSKYEKLQAESSQPKPDPEKEQLLKDRETWNKSRAELENEIKFANYERSQEYKDKYQQPFLKAYESGQKLITALTVKEPDQKDQYGDVTEPGKTRKGTEADWDALMAITDENAASEFIAEHFGHSAARVTVLRDKVLDLHGQMRAAVEDFRKQGTERETAYRETLSKQQKEVSARWHAANTHAAQKYPQYFAPDPADSKATALWEAGARLADLAFGVLDPADVSKLPPAIQSKFVNGQLPPADRTLLHSAIRNRAAAYDRLIYKLGLSEAAQKELADKLAGYEKSEPGRGQARKVEASGKKGPPATLDEVDSAFDQLAAANG